MSSKGRNSVRGVARVAIVALATFAPAVAIWTAIGWANPPHHDLSDAATGLMQLFFAAIAGLMGLAASVLATRGRGPN